MARPRTQISDFDQSLDHNSVIPAPLANDVRERDQAGIQCT